MKRISKAKRAHLLAVVAGRLCACGQAGHDVGGVFECEGCYRRKRRISGGRYYNRIEREVRAFLESP